MALNATIEAARVGEAGKGFEIVTTIASAVEQQGAATQEIARNVQRASAGTQEVSSNIVAVTLAAGETGAAAAQVQSVAREMSIQSQTLREQVDTFLASIRAA